MSRSLSRLSLLHHTHIRLPIAPPYIYFTRFSTSILNMSQYEYLVTIPDHVNSLSKRLAARPKHLANLKPHIESGKIVFGGASLSRQPGEGEAPDMTGSVMLIKASSEEEVREWIANDEYVKGGAWDVSKMTIVPFRCAVRTAL